MGKLESLAKFLKCEEDEVSFSRDDDCIFEACGCEYVVCSEEEAYEKAKNYILESLWAFKPSFLFGYVDCDNYQSFIDAISEMQEKMCESCNEIIRSMIGEKLENFISDAISADGRGHFIASYDFEEQEQDDYLIYRIN